MLESVLVVSLETGSVLRVLNALPVSENEATLTLNEKQNAKFRAVMCEQLAAKLVMPGCESCQGAAVGKFQELDTYALYFLWSVSFDLYPPIAKVLKLIDNCIIYWVSKQHTKPA